MKITSFRTPPVQQTLTQIADLINNKAVESLTDIDWEQETQWEFKCVKEVIDNIDDKISVIDCILLKYEQKKPRSQWGYGFGYELSQLKADIEAKEKFNLQKIKNATQPQQLTTPNNSKEEKILRIIDEEKWKPYFISTFKGMGNGNINHFSTMVEELKTDRIPKEFARIALMIYDSNKMSDRKPNTFAEWYNIFCECVGCEKKTYKPSQLKPLPEKLTKLFNYLS